MITPAKINAFTFLKLPSCWWCGVRVQEITPEQCVVTVKHRWFNQNPFNSMYFAVQAMAAELSTGALVMSYIKESDARVSMLVANNEATFTKKATGKITFTCTDGLAIKEAIEKTVTTGQGQTVWMEATGINQDGIQVSKFRFEWTVKRKG
ncbi:protein of unknown function [Nonlabens sp. Hel1_33_55]|uniref:DUF4442 domain-containing protein n=1 Tax=Nonlabens sp. Hel1_33_55 TaxID=1336802 RepID=UPI000875F0B1|nr:DUF4442 domain-containing protein [Nonlabens sp. Hel1_33_55]SCY13881.1 protein of unknown function [Nonlabens sp. Hel1_33_55]